jgi:hypothetical protein
MKVCRRMVCLIVGCAPFSTSVRRQLIDSLVVRDRTHGGWSRGGYWPNSGGFADTRELQLIMGMASHDETCSLLGM